MTVDRIFSILTLSSVTFAAACGGTESPDAAADGAVAIDSTIVTDLPREPLTEADLAGDLALADLAVEIPWTRNSVSRDPGPAAARATVQDSRVLEAEGFDRVSFTFSGTTPFPGYEIRWTEPSESLTCGEEGQAVETEAEQLLVVRLHPARVEGSPSLRRSMSDATRFHDTGLVCNDGQAVVWAAGLNAGEQVRVMEFRNPPRLVVDVR